MMANFDPTRRELMRALQPFRARITAESGRDAWDFDRETAIYWFAHDYHGGQWSNLYSVLCTSPYRPGPCKSGINSDEEPSAFDLFLHLVVSFGFNPETHLNPDNYDYDDGATDLEAAEDYYLRSNGPFYGGPDGE